MNLVFLSYGRENYNQYYFRHKFKITFNYGGVVPELASRLHVQNFTVVLKTAVQDAKIQYADITHVAYTKKPGLIGSLIVGAVVAKTFSQYLGVPLLGMHHIEGHMYAANIEKNSLIRF
jgi:N6-L-threonylcarbamoyladenine synthase